MTIEELRERVQDFLRAHDPATSERLDFLRARYDAGLAWVHYPVGHGGLGLEQAWYSEVERLLAEAGAPDNNPRAIGIGLGHGGADDPGVRDRRAEGSASCARCGPARRSGASCSASREPGPTSRRSRPARSPTATAGG